MKTLILDNSAGRPEWMMTPIAHINDINAMEASKPANAMPIALWVVAFIAILFGASWMAVPLYFVG